MTNIKNADDLLEYIIARAQSGEKAWFGFPQQKIVGIFMAYEIARLHADKLSPEQAVNYVVNLNNLVFDKLVKKA